MSRQIVLDTETTGLSAAAGDRIIEIGCVELVNRKLTGNNLHLYLNPERDSHEDALKVHGISNEFLRDKPRFAEVVDTVLDYLRGAELIIHNADFDLGFLNKELELLGREPLEQHIAGVIDTLRLAKQQFPGKRNSLDALCDRLGVDNSHRTLHGALLDAELLAEVYIGLTRGQDALPIEGEEELAADGARVSIDLRQFELPVIEPNEAERLAHQAVLAELDKASGGRTLWVR
ncbi:DNA polymerase-3 subunit epsilon [Tibeticola sediminis]|jgi:DNA polymerase-3 subunit epsilon|uniref:DNA polymerase III subunit epsilon n=1 Tax=Tibeticola sediminis TaxID=1917811 RepID=A0A3N4VAE8_9BURK|nr:MULTISPECIES: DNA polymerase III subunit epsilon [Tibeticola]MCI4440028.1 DNA polymerase III subunit epsilon [Tibeticola sp.]RPE70790.1 DNA polymerase-3 subunit epsilon [Tibeticola sediminis]